MGCVVSLLSILFKFTSDTIVILIIGTPSDHRCGALIQRLLERKLPFSVFNTQDFPHHSFVDYDIESPQNGHLQTPDMDAPISLSDITGVYYCTNNNFKVINDDPPEVRNIVYNNIDSAAWSFFFGLSCPFYNPIQPANHHNYKVNVLQDLRAAGIRVPDSVITNRAEAVLNFYEQQNKRVVAKPPWGQAFTERLTPDHLKDSELNKLTNAPILLQEYIDGNDKRAYVIGNEVFGVEILSDSVDLNQDMTHERRAYDLTEEIKTDCLTISKVTNLPFTAIDFRETPDGEIVYFEANSSPDFTCDMHHGYALDDCLIDCLLGKS